MSFYKVTFRSPIDQKTRSFVVFSIQVNIQTSNTLLTCKEYTFQLKYVSTEAANIVKCLLVRDIKKRMTFEGLAVSSQCFNVIAVIK